VLIDNPVNVATPLDADTVLVPLSVPGPPLLGVPLAMATVMDAELLVTVLPYWSSTATAGCVGQAIPPVPPPGCWLNASLLADPGLTVSCCVALVSPLLAAVMVGVPALVSV
jgi:hypothetical protein